MGDKFADIRQIAAKERELKRRLKELEREREQSDKINFLVEEREKLWKELDAEKNPKKCEILAQKIRELDKLIKDYEDSDATDSEKEKMYDSDATDDDPAVLEPESDENALQYIKLKL